MARGDFQHIQSRGAAEPQLRVDSGKLTIDSGWLFDSFRMKCRFHDFAKS